MEDLLFSSSAVFGWEVSRGSAAQVLPIFKRNAVNAVFSGHELVYERLKPEEGIRCFILGNSVKRMNHDFRSKQDMEVGVDTDRAFMIVEFAGNLCFQTIFEPTDIRRPQWTKTNQQQKTTAY